MSKKISAAQAAQQNNRDAGGRYSFGAHAEASDLNLHESTAQTPRELALKRMDQALARLNIARSELAKHGAAQGVPRPSNAVDAALPVAQDRHAQATADVMAHAARLYRAAGSSYGHFYAKDMTDPRKLKRRADGLLTLKTKRTGADSGPTKAAAAAALHDEGMQDALHDEKVTFEQLCQARTAYNDREPERLAELRQLQDGLRQHQQLDVAHEEARRQLTGALREVALHEVGFGDAVVFRPEEYRGVPALSREPDGGLNISVWQDDPDAEAGGSWLRALNALPTGYGSGNTLILEDGKRILMGRGWENYRRVTHNEDVPVAVRPPAMGSTRLEDETGSGDLFSNTDGTSH